MQFNMKLSFYLLWAAIFCFIDVVVLLVAAQTFDILVATAFILILVCLRKSRVYEKNQKGGKTR